MQMLERNTAMNTRNMEYKLHTGHRTFQKRKGSMEKKQMICEHCCKPGHNKETCFKLHGIPEWYKDLNEQKKRGTFNNRVYVATEAQNSDDKGSTQRADIISELMEALKLKCHRIRSKFILLMTLKWQDLMTKKQLAIGKQVGKLYLLDRLSAWPHSPHKSKFDPRAFKCIFIGYVLGQKAYKLYDLKNKTVLISRDVTFHENVFPYHDHSIPDTSPVLVPVSILDQTPEYTNTDTIIAPVSDSPPLDSHSSSIQTSVPNIPLRKSHRHIKPPSWLTDFYCNHSSTDFIHPSDLASSHTDFWLHYLLSSNYLQAKGCKEWEDAMSQELSALERNNTWEVVTLPKGKKAIGSKWVFKIKLKADGSIDRYKARLVAKGYNQVEGVDYVDRFSPCSQSSHC
ncbi:UNVERIFIED_CONTAM: Retrovirus-related Pol polyprotein from transposon TNT 1-94 [Sesamum angustifolium]|uniref:Retrovirus-related Pol polyprotein from transposon TNT 1-94 n=1 Tax=Sesamum angustifolium TaxID=2727405 RepID=A0AAW2QBH9_9LAMI